MLPTIYLRDVEVSRLIVGGNPVSGNSHVNAALDEEMRDYFTTEKVKEMLRRCEECGITTLQMRGDMHITRILREYRLEGGKMKWIGQTAPEYGSYERNVNQIAEAGADALYHHGTMTDMFFKKKEYDTIKERLAVIRRTGLPVGLATHMPEVIRYAEEHHWDVDFYMGSVYNISRVDRVSSAVSGQANGEEPFFEEDIPLMYEALREASKPCLAFKILGASRRCQTQETVRNAFAEAFREIKDTDGVIVGMYPKQIDQVGLNCQYTQEAIAAKKGF